MICWMIISDISEVHPFDEVKNSPKLKNVKFAMYIKFLGIYILVSIKYKLGKSNYIFLKFFKIAFRKKLARFNWFSVYTTSLRNSINQNHTEFFLPL